ncbi:hypothetical protein [Streptomyces sp. NPDC054866]
MMLDLSDMFGEGWCVTLAPLGAAQALECLGVREASVAPDGVDMASRRLEEGLPGPEVLLLGREVREGWSLVLELEGSGGWAGMGLGALAGLSANGRVAVSAFQDPNQIMVDVAADGVVLCQLDVTAGYFTPPPPTVITRRCGPCSPQGSPAMTSRPGRLPPSTSPNGSFSRCGPCAVWSWRKATSTAHGSPD